MIITAVHALATIFVLIRFGLVLCVVVLSGLSTSARCQQIVVYPRAESTNDERAEYPIALLRLCEKRAGTQFQLRPSQFRAQQGRNLIQLEQGQGIDIVWTLTSPEREQNLLPIRIPIDRGLIGWRLLLIRDADAALFAKVQNKEDLAALRAGQGHDWPDVSILKSNHFNVATSTTYEGLFHMLAQGHIYYFPRSVSEIWPELQAHSALPLQIENNLVLHYPSALYFFVKKSNVQLAKTLESCLNEATRDGSLRDLFNNYFSDSLKRAQLSRRRIIFLTNPLLSPATPLSKAEYWYSPMEKN